MSFPYKKKPKTVERYGEIFVNYQDDKMEYFRESCLGIKARIFQHEIDHGDAKFIYQ